MSGPEQQVALFQSVIPVTDSFPLCLCHLHQLASTATTQVCTKPMEEQTMQNHTWNVPVGQGPEQHMAHPVG